MIQPYSKDHIKAVTFPDMPLVSYDFQIATMTWERNKGEDIQLGLRVSKKELWANMEMTGSKSI